MFYRTMHITLLVSVLFSNNSFASAHDLDPKLENPFQMRRDIADAMSNCKFAEAIATQQKYLDFGTEPCRQMALITRTAYLPKVLPPPKNAEAMLKEVIASNSLSEKIKIAKKCAQAYPKFEYAHLELATAYSNNLEDSKAERECLIAQSIAPTNERVLTMLGIIYIHRGKEKKAR